MQPATSTDLDILFSFTQGDTWPGIPSMLWSDNVPADDIASAILQYRKLPLTPTVSHELSTADATITIVDAALWELAFPAGDLPLKAGSYAASLRTTDVNGVVTTWFDVFPTISVPITR